MNNEQIEFLESVANNNDFLEIARRAIENTLVDLRDARIGILMRNNGLVIKEKDGMEFSLIRMAPEIAVSIGLNAIAEHLKNNPQ